MIEQQQIEELVKTTFWRLLGDKASLQGKGLIARISKIVGLDELTVQGALASLAQSRWLSGVYANGIPTGKVVPLADRPVASEPPSLVKWLNALHESGLREDEVAALIPLHEAVSDFSHDDLIQFVKGLLKLSDAQTELKGMPSFLVSAEYLLGSSKLLDSLPSKALHAFGINTRQFTGAPPVVLVAGPPRPKMVVLVENPHAFWKAISTSAVEETAFVVTFGYGLSRQGEDYGNQLASLLENKTPLLSAVCAGSPPPIMELLNYGNITFWGDLDVEGLRIYQRLRKAIPQLSLNSLYRPMLEAVCDPARSHGYVKAAAKHKQVSAKSTDAICREEYLELLAACGNRAVDQEAVTCEEIITHVGGTFTSLDE